MRVAMHGRDDGVGGMGMGVVTQGHRQPTAWSRGVGDDHHYISRAQQGVRSLYPGHPSGYSHPQTTRHTVPKPSQHHPLLGEKDRLQ